MRMSCQKMKSSIESFSHSKHNLIDIMMYPIPLKHNILRFYECNASWRENDNVYLNQIIRNIIKLMSYSISRSQIISIYFFSLFVVVM